MLWRIEIPELEYCTQLQYIKRVAYRYKESFLRKFAMLLVQHFLIDAHSGGHEERNGQQNNTDGPPKEHGK